MLTSVKLHLINGKEVDLTPEQGKKLLALWNKPEVWEKLPKIITIGDQDIPRADILGIEEHPKPPMKQSSMIDALLNQGADMSWYERSKLAKSRVRFKK